MNKYRQGDAITTSSFALLDHGAEVFTKKMFQHCQSKTRERWNDLERSQLEKKSFTIRPIGRRAEFNQG